MLLSCGAHGAAVVQALVEEAEEAQWGLYQLAMEGNTSKKVEFRGTRLGYHPELGKGIVAAYDIPAADKQRVSMPAALITFQSPTLPAPCAHVGAIVCLLFTCCFRWFLDEDRSGRSGLSNIYDAQKGGSACPRQGEVLAQSVKVAQCLDCRGLT